MPKAPRRARSSDAACTLALQATQRAGWEGGCLLLVVCVPCDVHPGGGGTALCYSQSAGSSRATHVTPKMYSPATQQSVPWINARAGGEEELQGESVWS